jgi:tetratricopeptide (TPR) repeat protein
VIYKKRIKKRPYAIGYRNSLMYKYYHMQRYGDALSVSNKMLELAPFSSSLYNTRGYIYQNLNQVEKAKENFKKAIYYNPTSLECL